MVSVYESLGSGGVGSRVAGAFHAASDHSF